MTFTTLWYFLETSSLVGVLYTSPRGSSTSKPGNSWTENSWSTDRIYPQHHDIIIVRRNSKVTSFFSNGSRWCSLLLCSSPPMSKSSWRPLTPPRTPLISINNSFEEIKLLVTSWLNPSFCPPRHSRVPWIPSYPRDRLQSPAGPDPDPEGFLCSNLFLTPLSWKPRSGADSRQNEELGGGAGESDRTGNYFITS